MTHATQTRIARLYEQVIGYNPMTEGWTAPEALEAMREMRAEGWHTFGKARINA